MAVNNFDVLKTMSLKGMKTIKLASHDNITQLQATKHGGLVTIGVDMDTIGKLLTNQPIIFAVIVADVNDFNQVKAELEADETKEG